MRSAECGVGLRKRPPSDPHRRVQASKRQDTIMPFLLAWILATAAEAYAVAGVLFALAFLPRGIVRVDERLHESPVSVRVLLFPGIAALWPLFAWRWMTGRGAPEERNPHRLAAERRS
jgi:hypothetical protein